MAAPLEDRTSGTTGLGHEALDRAAQAMIEAGARHTPIPDVLRGKAFSVVLPVVFDINDE